MLKRYGRKATLQRVVFFMGTEGTGAHSARLVSAPVRKSPIASPRARQALSSVPVYQAKGERGKTIRN
jgi:hypothetical protein